MSTATLHDSPWARAWQRMRNLLLARPWIGTETLIVGACLYFSLFANGVFWRAAAPQPLTQWQWALSLFLLPRMKGVMVGFQWAKRMHGFGGDRTHE